MIAVLPRIHPKRFSDSAAGPKITPEGPGGVLGQEGETKRQHLLVEGITRTKK